MSFRMVDPSRRMSGSPLLRDVLVGAPLLLVWLTVLTGSLYNAGAALTMSIVCTLGVGAVFWGLLAWILGAVTVLLVGLVIRLLGGSWPGASRHGFSQVTSGPVIKAYVARRRQAGGDDDHIRADLLRGGWSAAEVEAALAAGRGDAPC